MLLRSKGDTSIMLLQCTKLLSTAVKAVRPDEPYQTFAQVSSKYLPSGNGHKRRKMSRNC